MFVEAADLRGVGRVEACEPPNRFLVVTRETDESWRQGDGVPRWQIHAETLATYLAGKQPGDVTPRRIHR